MLDILSMGFAPEMLAGEALEMAAAASLGPSMEDVAVSIAVVKSFQEAEARARLEEEAYKIASAQSLVAGEWENAGYRGRLEETAVAMAMVLSLHKTIRKEEIAGKLEEEAMIAAISLSLAQPLAVVKREPRSEFD